ncbi:insulinase family protein [Candidatus Gribaldobacteria bacterium]|nr:insulinase family protein [Candidatus Gribaldobacteria bacterium]
MEFKKIKLRNGLRIILAPEKEAKTAAVFILTATGSKYETKELNGISHFLEHLFFKGTKKRPTALKVAETLDKVGGSYNAFTSKEMTGYWAKVSSEHLDLALDFIADIFLNSKFEAKEIEKERGVIIEEINMYLDSPRQYVGEIWEDVLYGDQPAGWDTIGFKENILRFKRKDFINYLKSHYSTKNTLICLAGKFAEKKLLNQIKHKFRQMVDISPLLKLPVKETQTKPKVLCKEKPTDQTHLCLGFRGVGLNSEKRFLQEVLAVILGGNMSSRMFTIIREKSGLAYYVNTDSETYTDSGYLTTQAGVPNNKIKEAIHLILKEYEKMRKEVVSAKELKKAKDFINGSMILGLEGADKLASFYATQEILENKTLTPEEIKAIINKIRAKDINNFAKEIFLSKNLNLALIGPKQNPKELEKILNNF